VLLASLWILSAAACQPANQLEPAEASTSAVAATDLPTTGIPASPGLSTVTQAPNRPSTVVPLPDPTHTPVPFTGALFVDASARLGAVNPLVFGTNYGPWQNLSKSMLPFVEAGGFTLLRFPGGNWGDEYALGENQFDEFIALARQLKAEPMVNVKLFKGTAEKAAQWVRYANLERGYAVRYWGIGNEPSLYASNRGLSGYDSAAFNQQWRELALAMKAVDPAILLVGPEIHQYAGTKAGNPVDQAGKDWMQEFLIANGDLVDIVSFHRYPFGSYDPSPEELLRSSAEWDHIIPSLRHLIQETTGRDLPIAVTEVNSNWSNRKGSEATPDSVYNAVWWADVLGRLMIQRVDLVAHFALEGTGGWSLMGLRGPKPSYYLYPLLQNFGSQLVYSSSDQPQIRIYAALRADGALTLVVINLSADPVSYLLKIEGFHPTGEAQAWLLDAGHNGDSIAGIDLSQDNVLHLPAQSVTLLVVNE
jgi:hypothetical protein